VYKDVALDKEALWWQVSQDKEINYWCGKLH